MTVQDKLSSKGDANAANLTRRGIVERYDTILRLREEALKSWDHLISDKLVYFDEVTEGGYDLSPLSPMAERYIVGRSWFEIHVYGARGDDHMYGIVIVNIQDLSSRDVGQRTDVPPRADRGGDMLLNLPKLVQNPERVGIRIIPSMIRLKVFDNWPSVIGKVGHEPRGVVQELLFGEVNREGGSARGESRRESGYGMGKLVSKVVERGPQTVDSIASDESEPLRDLLKLDVHMIDTLLKIRLSRDGVGLEILPGCELGIEGVQMYLRPLQLEPDPVEVCHAVYSEYERRQAERADADDASGPRDSSAGQKPLGSAG